MIIYYHANDYNDNYNYNNNDYDEHILLMN